MQTWPPCEDKPRGWQPAPDAKVKRARPAYDFAHAVPRSLASNFVWGLAGNLGYGASQWGLVIALARLGDETMVGQFALAVAVTTPILLFAGLALRTVQATDAREDFCFGEYLALRLLTTAAALTIVAAIVAFAPFDSVTRYSILAVGVAKAIESFSDLLHGVLQRHERMDLIGRSLIIRGLASFIVVTVVIHSVGEVAWASLGLVLCALISLVGYDLPVSLRVAANDSRLWTDFLRPSWNVSRIAKLWRLTLPLGLTVLLGALVTNIPRYAVEQSLGTAELGVFAALAWFTTAGNMVVNALAHSAAPRLSRFHAAGELAQFRALLARLLVFAGILAAITVLGVWWLGPMILELVYGASYAKYADVFQWMAVALGFAFGICFLDTALFAARRFLVQLPINLVVGLLGAAACAVFVPQHGLHGAAGVVLGCTLVQLLARLVPVWQTAYASHQRDLIHAGKQTVVTR